MSKMPRKAASAARHKNGSGGKKTARWNGVPGQKGHRREAILRSVASVLRNSRFSSLTMEDVAAELGITKGNLYYYFKDKQDILYQCHMRSMEISLCSLERALQTGRTPAEKLRLLLIGHIRGVVDEGFGGILQTDLENLRSDQRNQYVRKRDELERGVRRLIEEGNRAGDFECPNVKLAGFAILGAINWIPKWYRANGPLTPEQISAEMVDYFLRGLQRGARAEKPAPARRKASLDNEPEKLQTTGS